MTKTAREILLDIDTKCPKCYDEGNGGDGCVYCWNNPIKDIAIDQALKELEAIIREAQPGLWVNPDETDDLEWQGYCKGVQHYENNLLTALYGEKKK